MENLTESSKEEIELKSVHCGMDMFLDVFDNVKCIINGEQYEMIKPDKEFFELYNSDDDLEHKRAMSILQQRKNHIVGLLKRAAEDFDKKVEKSLLELGYKKEK